jgi:hypothetical protein
MQSDIRRAAECYRNAQVHADNQKHHVLKLIEPVTNLFHYFDQYSNKDVEVTSEGISVSWNYTCMGCPDWDSKFIPFYILEDSDPAAAWKKAGEDEVAARRAAEARMNEEHERSELARLTDKYKES